MQWLEQNRLVPFNDYPYTGVQGDCEQSKAQKSAPQTLTDSNPIKVGNSDSALQTACSNYGPISIVVDASAWQYYTTGTMNASECGYQVDHAVQLVGYTSSYYIVKNSWGTNWG